MMENCRVCYETTQGTNAKNLFDSKQSILLHHLEILTGEWLTNEINSPTYICNCCEQDLKVAVSLRERCIKTQRSLRNRNTCASPTSDTIDEIKLEEDLIDESEHSETDQCADAYSNSALDCTGEEQVDDITYYENFDEEADKLIIISSDIKEEEIQSIEDENEFEAQPLNSPNITSLEPPKEIPVPVEQRNLNHCSVSTEKAKKGRSSCICDQCGRHFSDLGNLKKHLMIHTGIKNYECEECKAKFYSSYLLKRHSLMHTSSPPTFACKYCGKTFIYNNYRLRCERDHFKEPRFNCDYCDKMFYKASAKRDHEVKHTGRREFHCELCDQAFSRRKHLMAHYRSKTHKNKEQKKKKNSLNLTSDAEVV